MIPQSLDDMDEMDSEQDSIVGRQKVCLSYWFGLLSQLVDIREEERGEKVEKSDTGWAWSLKISTD